MIKQTLITIGRLKLYHEYSGDGDGFARVGHPDEKTVFGSMQSQIWSAIEGAIQGVELIAEGLVSNEYAAKTLQKLRESCDDESYETLTAKLN
ncbi:hypothetical protein [Spirosoma pollinicola]|uniref:Uncharacterized protein n=1 Tax=Spirosoma pollinicola TaxID=2057025 RepID=A0A2K8Z126_9BACT|nr:hypothetical protein [Spirosoma pollinicola]AUD03538.1 hypothetical protein CWM47_17910 [Spirosoma pollinicola]